AIPIPKCEILPFYARVFAERVLDAAQQWLLPPEAFVALEHEMSAPVCRAIRMLPGRQQEEIAPEGTVVEQVLGPGRVGPVGVIVGVVDWCGVLLDQCLWYGPGRGVGER